MAKYFVFMGAYLPPLIHLTEYVAVSVPEANYFQIRVINRKQEVPHDGPMCDLMWSDPEGIASVVVEELQVIGSLRYIRVGT